MEGEGKDAEDSFLAVSTKNNQIVYLNITSQAFEPDYLKLKREMK